MNYRFVKGAFLLIAFAMSLFGCNLQSNMLYYPSASLPSEAELAASRIRFWPSGQNGYRGFIGAVEINNCKGTVIVFHGNAGTASDRDYYVSTLGTIGYRVILAEYPGYGARVGELGEQSFVEDARATIRFASEKYGTPLLLLGESLGCGVAAGAAGDKSLPIDGIILMTPWDTLQAVAKSKFPLLPVRWFMKDSYDNIENLKSFRGPIAVVSAERDEIIPIRHAETLFTALSGNKRMWTIKGAGHNDWFDRVGPSWWQTITDYAGGGTR